MNGESGHHTSVRLDAENVKWFNDTFPDRGALPAFLNRALDEYRRLWGDTPPPHEVTVRAVQNIFNR